MRTTRLLFVIALIAGLGAVSPPATAATWTVTRLDDPAPDGCHTNGCSLREAIIAANASASGSEQIHLPAGHIRLTIAGVDDASQVGDLDITTRVQIRGRGIGVTTIDAGGGDLGASPLGDRIFDVRAPFGDAGIYSATIAGGSAASSDGGAIRNAARLEVIGVELRDNSAELGGAIRHSGANLSVLSSSIHHNVAEAGGGISSGAGDVRIASSSFVNNQSLSGSGGGIANGGTTTFTVSGSTFERNRAGMAGGAISTSWPATVLRSTLADNVATTIGGGLIATGDLIVRDSTITGNRASTSGGGGIYSSAVAAIERSTIVRNQFEGFRQMGASGTLEASIVAHNAGNDCVGTTSLGYNVVDASCPSDGPGDVVADPQIGPLEFNGGPTPTHEIGAGSPAVDRHPAGDDECGGTDQRGLVRPAGPGCDSGAYELTFCADKPVNVIGTPGDDDLDGTGADDGILAFGGNDLVNGWEGNDAICGGTGNDTLFGGTGDDTLNGESGRRDKCFGGAGTVAFSKCEKKVQS